MIKLQPGDNSVSFQVRVQPRAPRTGVAGEIDGALKVRLSAPPVDGEANEELIRFLAKLFDIPRSRIEIILGLTSKNKTLRMSGVTVEYCQEKLKQSLGALT